MIKLAVRIILQASYGMHILALSGLHGHLPWYEWVLVQAEKRTWDLVTVAGDFLDLFSTTRSVTDQIAFHLEWFEALAKSDQPFAFCSGNHDANDEPLAVATSEPLPEILSKAFQEDRWMDATRCSSIVVDDESRKLETGAGPIVVTTFPWRYCRESMSLRHPHAEDIEEARAGQNMAMTEGCPWLVLIHDPPSPSVIATGREVNATKELLDTFQPDLCLTGHIHEAPFLANGSHHARIGRTLCVNPGRRDGPLPHALIVERKDSSWFCRDLSANLDSS